MKSHDFALNQNAIAQIDFSVVWFGVGFFVFVEISHSYNKKKSMQHFHSTEFAGQK